MNPTKRDRRDRRGDAWSGRIRKTSLARICAPVCREYFGVSWPHVNNGCDSLSLTMLAAKLDPGW